MRSCHGHGAMMTREGPFTAACDSYAEALLGSEHESAFLNADFHVREGSTRALLSDRHLNIHGAAARPDRYAKIRNGALTVSSSTARSVSLSMEAVPRAHPRRPPDRRRHACGHRCPSALRASRAPRRSSRCRIVSDGAVPAGTRRGRFLTFPGRAIRQVRRSP